VKCGMGHKDVIKRKLNFVKYVSFVRQSRSILCFKIEENMRMYTACVVLLNSVQSTC
jgi:hypothetical protein